MSNAMDDLFDAFESDDESDTTPMTTTPASTTTKRSALPPPSPPSTKKPKVNANGEGKPNVDTALLDEKKIATGTAEDKSINSFSAIPAGYNPLDNPTTVPTYSTPAKTYPYPLDPFQKQSIEYIEANQSVLVAAHTSAGKTTVAEYAVATALRNKSRVIYTSPIKALSNQKYRDLQEEFGDVGLMTGDITINPGAACLVMTTEILRSMLYRGSELMREVSWVIYDEVHYMRDKERGVVWEESIILLPHSVRFVFLSATIPNSRQFVGWIAHIHQQPCHVVYTNYRPVPLQHYIFPAGGEGLHLVVDEKGNFREDNFQRAMSSLQNVDQAQASATLESGSKGSKKPAKKDKKQKSDLYRIVKLVMERGLNPVIIFSFSKKDCEKYALDLNKEDYNDNTEKDLVEQVYTNAIDSLSDDDKKLPQVEALLPLLRRGIGIHHGGLLPILKEIVEILFSEGLIKCLFATETFSIGINMPAKTVVFTNCRKWDGTANRWVTSGEYIQMSGRAGRRGKDDRGIVIQMMDEKMEPAVCKGILYGDPDPLNSSYHISYNMLLNMMRVEEVDPEFLIKASFHQYQQESEAPLFEAQAEEFENAAAQIEIIDGELVGQYFGMKKQLRQIQDNTMDIVRDPANIRKFLQAGRLVNLYEPEADINWGWSVVTGEKERDGNILVDVLVRCVKEEDATGNAEDVVWKVGDSTQPFEQSSKDGGIAVMKLHSLPLSAVREISAVRMTIPADVMLKAARKNVCKSVAEINRRFPEGLPPLDPINDMKINSPHLTTLIERSAKLGEALSAHGFSKLGKEEKKEKLDLYEEKQELLDKGKLMRRKVKNAQTMVMKDELKKMKKVLKHMGHVDGQGVIQLKGRTACEINTANELVATELTFGGIFNEFTVEQTVALLSCFTFDEKSKQDSGDPGKGLRPVLGEPFKKLQEAARVVAKSNLECRIECDEDEFIGQFNPGLMEAVYAWCKGAKFVDVQKLCDSYEGTTIRTLRRLEELVRQLACAATAVGNAEMRAKFEKGSELIKRDIVFCNSLYL